MRAFAEAFPDEPFVQQVAAQIPWGHNMLLLDRVNDACERAWYLRQTVEHGWSRSVLTHQLEGDLYDRQGRAITNFHRTLPAPQSDLAHELLKDPYHFDFLEMGADVRERELEHALLARVQRFLLELGSGFALVGSQYRLEVSGKEYALDLLFYHIRLRCFVVVDLKVGAFEPEHAGKMSFYLSAVDDALRHDHDQPSIGLILCKERNRVVVEYALRGTRKPIGVAGYRLTGRLPARLRENLPAADELERALGPDTEGEG